MRFDKTARNRKAETEPAGLAVVAAVEFFENALR